MKVSKNGIQLIKQFEGVELKAYRDAVGVWTIGYGHTSAAGGLQVKAGLTITQRQADEMLANDLGQYERGVMDAIAPRMPNQNQFDAMVSLAYNIGVGAFKKSSVARHFKAGSIKSAAASFLLWNKAKGRVLKGLTNRRQKEMALFLSGVAKVEHVAPVAEPQIVANETKTALPSVSVKGAGVAAIMTIIALVAASFGFGD